jgi:hypothetical protein
MRSAVYSHIDHIPAVDMMVDLARLPLFLKGLRRRAVALSVSFPAVCCALSSRTRRQPIIACVYERHSSPQQGHA